MKNRVLAAGVTVLAGLGLPLSASAAASPVGSDESQVSNGACLVPPGGKMECFATVAAMEVRAKQVRMFADASCPVTLYSAANYTGRVLELTPQGYWMNLSNYGFDNAAVSFKGTGCGFHLAQNQNGGGYWYPGNTAAWAVCPNMGAGWNDVVSSVYID